MGLVLMVSKSWGKMSRLHLEIVGHRRQAVRGPVDGLYICCCNICWVDIICGGAITWDVPMPVVGIRMEAAVILVIGLLVNPFVKPFVNTLDM